MQQVISPVVKARLSAQDIGEVRSLVERVQAVDRTPPFSDHVMLHLPGGGDADVRHVLVQDEELVGYAHLDVTDQVTGPSAELAVLPTARGRGIGRALVDELIRLSPDGRLRLWAHGDNPAAEKLAVSLGFQRLRTLWQMRMPLTAPLPAPALPAGLDLRPFVVGEHEQEWTALNNRAFADHPDQGGWSQREVEIREAEPWFDPAGFFLAFRDEQMVGFHWTKVHGGTTHAGHQHEAVGEVYVVGVDPSEQGRGLGPAMTLIGLHHLQQQGLSEVLLYVDEGNTNAIRTYDRLGFARSGTDTCFHRQVR